MNDLYYLDTKTVMDPSVVHEVRSIETCDKEQYDIFVQERFVICQRPITYKITKNKLSIFRKQPKKAHTKTNYQAASLKENCSLFARLYISCPARDGDLSTKTK